MTKLKTIDNMNGDMLDKNVINIFKPIFYMQGFLGSLRVNFKYRFITPPHFMQQICSIIIWSVNIISMIHYIVFFNSESTMTDLSVKLGVAINGSTCAVIAFQNNFLSGNLNSQLFVKLQGIERELKINLEESNKKLGMFSFVVIIAATVWSAFWLIIFNTIIMKSFCLSFSISLVASIGNYIELVLVFFIIYFLVVRLEAINDLLCENDAKMQKSTILCKPNILFGKKLVRGKDRVPDKIVKGVCCILDAFRIFMELFQYSVSFLLSYFFLVYRY